MVDSPCGGCMECPRTHRPPRMTGHCGMVVSEVALEWTPRMAPPADRCASIPARAASMSSGGRGSKGLPMLTTSRRQSPGLRESRLDVLGDAHACSGALAAPASGEGPGNRCDGGSRLRPVPLIRTT